MKQLVTSGIVLKRTEYGEADRIITLLTPDQGKIALMAKGVRKAKSKLAGGIELFSVSSLTYLRGRGEVGTLISSRLEKHYGTIIKHLDRTMLGYELIKRLDRATEDTPEPEYFELLKASFEALEAPEVPLPLITLWFNMQLLRLGGNAPNLTHDPAGNKLEQGARHTFSYDDVAFVPHPEGPFDAGDIKFLRLGFAGHPPHTLYQVQGSAARSEAVAPLVQAMLTTYVRI